MKKHLAALWLCVPAALSAASFEGKVNFRLTAERAPAQEISYQIKGDKIRMEMPGKAEFGGIIMDVTKRETIMIMDEQRMYMVMPVPDVAAQAAQAAASDDAKLEATNETAKIAGYTAKKYIVTHQGTKTDLWLAEGLGTFMAIPNANPMGGRPPAGGSGQAWERALAGKDLFPLRVVSRDAGGQENFRMEATAVEKKSLSDSLFAPPAGYQKFDMGGMMQGMMPGMLPGGAPPRRRK